MADDETTEPGTGKHDAPAASLGRRKFLKGTAAAAAATSLPVAGALGAGPVFAASASAAFAGATVVEPGAWPQGVASGDPRPDSVVIWTRIDPAFVGGAEVDVRWQVATDAAFSSVLADGTVRTGADRDHTVKARAAGLPSGTTVYYRFACNGIVGPTGRSRTAPAAGASVDRLRLGVVSCQDWGSGYYSAYRAMLRENLDAVMHLGDYIYESGSSFLSVRADVLPRPRTVEQFWAKYRLYRSDTHLQAIHASLPFIVVWDDHEIENDCDRTTDPALLDAGHRAWFDYQPVMADGPSDDARRIYRSLRWGSLAEMIMLDSRQYRDAPPGAPGDPQSIVNSTVWPGTEIMSETRTMLGTAQRDWVVDRLGTDAQWKVLGNPVMMSPLRLIDLDEPWIRQIFPAAQRNAGIYLNADQWDGFQTDRRRVLGHVEANGISDVVVLTGDIHTYWASELANDFDDPAARSVAAEFVCGSVTSTAADVLGDGPLPEIDRLVLGLNPRTRFVNLNRHGYATAEFRADGLTVAFRTVDLRNTDVPARTLAAFSVASGSSAITPAPDPAG